MTTKQKLSDLLQQENLLRQPKVEIRTGIPRSTMYRWISEGTFPKPIPLGRSRTVGWLQTEIDQWIENQIKDGRSKSPTTNKRKAK